MRQLFLERGILSIKEVCEPKLDDYSVIVSVHYSFISSGKGLANIVSANQELFYENVPNKVKKILEIVTQHGVDYTAKMIKEKLVGRIMPLGQSCSGQVVALGKEVKKFRVGDFVACAGPGLANHADVVCVPQNLITPIKSESFLKEASLTAVGAMALQSIRRANLQLGESVCIFGLETLGHLIAQLAKISGCKVVGVDYNQDLLLNAKQSGIPYTYNFSHDNLLQSIDLLTNSIGVDCVIITPDCAQGNIINDALKIVRKKGRIVIVENSDIQLKKTLIGQKEIDILFSLSYGPGRYDPLYEYKGQDYPYPYVRWTENRNMEVFANLIETNQINLTNFVKNSFNLNNISKAIENINQNNSLGVVLNYLEDKKFGCAYQKDEKITFIPAFKDSVRVGIVGASKFMQLNLMPIISKLNNVVVDTIIDRDMASSLNAAKFYPGALAYTGNAGIFSENNCNVVIVSPSADITTDEIISILEKGKAIFMAKSLETNSIDFKQLKQFILKNKKAYLCVGYHRTHSPFINKIKKIILNRSSPLMIQYRFNAGFIPKEQRMQTEWKSGRIMIQAPHIFDLFCYLIDSKPISVSVEALKHLNNIAFPTDNFCATISFEDGSVCSLLFTSLGHMDLGKERMELFYDSKTIVMEDYVSLIGYGISPTFDERVKVPDQGYEKLVTSFFENIKGDRIDMTFDLERLVIVTDLALIVDALVCQGGGEVEL